MVATQPQTQPLPKLPPPKKKKKKKKQKKKKKKKKPSSCMGRFAAIFFGLSVFFQIAVAALPAFLDDRRWWRAHGPSLALLCESPVPDGDLRHAGTAFSIEPTGPARGFHRHVRLNFSTWTDNKDKAGPGSPALIYIQPLPGSFFVEPEDFTRDLPRGSRCLRGDPWTDIEAPAHVANRTVLALALDLELEEKAGGGTVHCTEQVTLHGRYHRPTPALLAGSAARAGSGVRARDDVRLAVTRPRPGVVAARLPRGCGFWAAGPDPAQWVRARVEHASTPGLEFELPVGDAAHEVWVSAATHAAVLAGGAIIMLQAWRHRAA
jgi:hypothetical protein